MTNPSKILRIKASRQIENNSHSFIFWSVRYNTESNHCEIRYCFWEWELVRLIHAIDGKNTEMNLMDRYRDAKIVYGNVKG